MCIRDSIKTQGDNDNGDIDTIMATVYDGAMNQFNNEILKPTLQAWGVIGVCRNSDTAADPG